MMQRKRDRGIRAAAAVGLLLVVGLALTDAPVAATRVSDSQFATHAGHPAVIGLTIGPLPLSARLPASGADDGGRTRPQPVDDLVWPLLTSSRVASTPITPRSSGQAGSARSQTPQPECCASPQPSTAAGAGGWSVASSSGPVRPARLAGANRSAPRPPPFSR